MLWKSLFVPPVYLSYCLEIMINKIVMGKSPIRSSEDMCEVFQALLSYCKELLQINGIRNHHHH